MAEAIKLWAKIPFIAVTGGPVLPAGSEIELPYDTPEQKRTAHGFIRTEVLSREPVTPKGATHERSRGSSGPRKTATKKAAARRR